MATAKIANTVLTTKPSDKAVAVDVYGSPPQNPTNNFKDVFGNEHSMQMNVLGKKADEKIRLKNLISAIDYTLGGNKSAQFYGFDGKSLGSFENPKDRLAKTFDVSKGLLYNYTGGHVNNMLSRSGFKNTQLGKVLDGFVKSHGGDSLEKLLTGGYTNASLFINNVKHNADVVQRQFKRLKDIDSLTDLTNLINDMAGDSEFLKVSNLGGLIQGLKGIADVANELGIPGVVDRVIEKQFKSKKDKQAGYLGLANNQSILFDLNYLDNLTKNASSGAILAANPFIIRDILANFKPTSEYPRPTKELHAKLLETLVKIDPYWDKFKYGDSYIPNLEVFQLASDFTRECFMLAESHVMEFTVCKLYYTYHINQIGKTVYPYLGINTSTVNI